VEVAKLSLCAVLGLGSSLCSFSQGVIELAPVTGEEGARVFSSLERLSFSVKEAATAGANVSLEGPFKVCGSARPRTASFGTRLCVNSLVSSKSGLGDSS